MPKRFLSKTLIDKYVDVNSKSKHFIKNPEKRELFKDIINSNFLKRKGNEGRITAFNRMWKKAQRISRLIYGKSVAVSERSKYAADFVREHTYYKSSFMSNFHYSKKIDIEESVRIAEYNTYDARTKKFREKYGDTKVEGSVIEGIDNLTINEYFEMFKNGEIDKDTMNEIISFFKTGYEYYKGQIGSD